MLRAHTLWERHGLDLKFDTQSTVYREHSSLNQTNARLRGSGWIDLAHDLAVLGSFQIAHLNEGVGTLSSPVNAIAPTPYDLFSGDLTVRKRSNASPLRWFSAASYDFGSTGAGRQRHNQDASDGQSTRTAASTTVLAGARVVRRREGNQRYVGARRRRRSLRMLSGPSGFTSASPISSAASSAPAMSGSGSTISRSAPSRARPTARC